MVKIRLMRVGKRKQPSFRVVVADARSPRDGRIIEAIGNYQPRLEPSGVQIDNERALYWLRTGAQASDQVRQLLRISGAWSEFTGEAPLHGGPPPPRVKKATPAASVTETAETADREADDEPAAAAEPVEAPEPEASAEATEAAAPEASAPAAGEAESEPPS
jgi:small subunit ribosomal protein S16